jgi:hypothetical protein
MNVERTVTIAAASKRRAASIAMSVVLAAAGAAHGDWLVLASGEAIETKGAWTLEGQKVVFTTKGGVLASVRATEVNVDASRALTAKKLEEATKVQEPTPPTPKRTPVLVLTDKDFEKAPPPAAAPADGAAAPSGADAPASAAAPGAPAANVAAPAAARAAQASAGSDATQPEPAPAAAPAAAARPIKQPIVVPPSDSLETRIAHQMPGPPILRITSWSARPTGEDQVSIFGVVQNVGSRVAAAVDIAVTLFDSEGTRLGSAEAAVTTTALMPNLQADFEAKFDGSPNFAEVQFVAKTVELELSQPANEGELDEPVGDEPHSTARTTVAKPKPRS